MKRHEELHNLKNSSSISENCNCMDCEKYGDRSKRLKRNKLNKKQELKALAFYFGVVVE